MVGESGSGKSVTALAAMGLLPPNARVSGEIGFAVETWWAFVRGMRQLRGREIGMIFQEPMTSLNPVFTVGDQIGGDVRAHERLSLKGGPRPGGRSAEKVGIPSPRRRLDDYPHQLSGGMRQRVMIAIALSCSPKLLIADEPTTALDVTIQAQLLELLNDLSEEFGTAIMLITHNMGVDGRSRGPRGGDVLGPRSRRGRRIPDIRQPHHPYTAGFLRAPPIWRATAARLTTIPGAMPNPADPPPGCLFSPRCPNSAPACDAARPDLRALPGDRRAACIFAEQAARELGA